MTLFSVRRSASFTHCRQALALGVLFFVGCDSNKLPIEPTPSPVVPVPPSGAQISGGVNDTAFRPLSGARVEVVGGPRAGTSATTDDAGRFLMDGTFAAGSMTVTASKVGYLPSTQSFTLREGQDRAGVGFTLELTTPSVNLAGEYLLTLTADSSCTALPDEVRTRTYIATISPTQSATRFIGRLSNATFVGPSNFFNVSVAGNFASFSFDDFCGPSIVEELEAGYLAINTEASGTVGASGITAPLNGYFEYCPRERAVISGDRFYCSTVTPVRSDTCVSRNHRLTLTRR